ncbi:30S ribosomal protein S3 [Candidatus Peregrinibacteria bacterium]|nr:30S ribosomal protein S3 [Candidatus Peregrinibacteria bacterium]
MGQKVNPKIQRIGIIYTWPSRWYAKKKDYTKLIHEDIEMQKAVMKELKDAGVAEIEIYRTAGNIAVYIHSTKPGIIIGRQGENIAELKEKLQKMFGSRFEISIKEIKKPDLNAYIVAENIARQIERRISYRRAAKMTIAKAMENGALGAKIQVSGRLNGVEIARSEYFSDGKIPLQTFRADIDYAYVVAKTKFGIIGIKAWIYKGEIFKRKKSGSLKSKTEKRIEEETTREFLPI